MFLAAGDVRSAILPTTTTLPFQLLLFAPAPWDRVLDDIGAMSNHFS